MVRPAVSFVQKSRQTLRIKKQETKANVRERGKRMEINAFRILLFPSLSSTASQWREQEIDAAVHQVSNPTLAGRH